MLHEPHPFQRWIQRQNPIPCPRIVELAIDSEVSLLQRQSQLGQIDLPLLNRPEIITDVYTALPPEPLSPDLIAWELQHPLDIFPEPLKCISPIVYSLLTNLNTPTVSTNLAEWPRPTIYSDLLAHLDSIPAITNGTFHSLLLPKNFNINLKSIELLPSTVVDIFDALINPGRAGKSYLAKEDAKYDAKLIGATPAAKRCRHGLPTDQCDVCKNERVRTAVKKPRRVPGIRTLDVFDLLLPYLQPPLDGWLAQPLLFPASRRPYDYQIEGIKFLAERSAALLGDEMGLGKTIQAIVALQVLYRSGKVRATLILCPRSLLGTWERELAKWAPELYIMRVRGTSEERESLWHAPASVYLTTYETLRQDTGKIPGLSTKFQVILLDEVQRIKNPTTGMARAVHRVNAPVRWALSGTPLENKIEDVVSIFSYLKPTLFTNEELWPDAVKRKIAPYFLRRRTADVREELPDKLTQEVWLELTDAQLHTYTKTEMQGKAELGLPGATRVHVFALINKLKQICNIDPTSKESCKIDYLVDQLDNVVETGQKALIFSHLPKVSLTQIEPILRGFGTAIFDGQLSDLQRERLIHDFQHHERPSVLLMSVQAGGIGLTLTAANHVFHLDHWWNPAIARQAEARAHRIGQERTVFVHDIYTVNTIEQRIYQLLQKKQALFDSIIDDLTTEYVKDKFTDEDLFALFDLGVPDSIVSHRELRTRDSTTKRLYGTTHPSQLRGTIETLVKPSQLDKLSPLEFEQYVAYLYEHMGFKTQLTSQSGDHGIDIIGMRRSEFGLEKMIVQCKHRPNGVVGEPEVRDLVGAWQEHRDAKTAVLVTSGSFSNAAKTMAAKQNVTLTDRIDIERYYSIFIDRLS